MIKFPRPIAILGGMRLPLCRINTNRMHHDNADMLTAVLKTLVGKDNFKRETLSGDDVGATIKRQGLGKLCRR